MGEPLSIISSAAGIIGLVDVALRGGKELYDFFSALKDAPQNVKSLSTELKHLNDILSEIQSFSSEYCQSEFVVRDGLTLKGHLMALMHTQDHVAILSNTIKPMEPDASQGKIKQLKHQLQWALMKDQVERLCQDLGRHKLTLLATLSLCGRRNELQIRKSQRAIERSLFNHQTSTLRHYRTLSTAVQQATQVSLEALGAIRGLEVAQSQGFEAVQASFSAQIGTNLAHTELIRQDDSTITKQILEIEDSASVGFSMTSQNTEDMVADNARGVPGKKEQNGWHVHVMNIDVESLTLSILLMKDIFRDGLHVVCPDDEHGDLTTHVIWSEINELLASSLEASALAARSRSRVPFVKSEISLLNQKESAASHDNFSGVLSEERSHQKDSFSEYSSPRIVPKPFKRSQLTRYHLGMTTDGLLSIEMNYGTTDDGEKMASTRVTFLPTIGSCRVGFVAHVSVSLQDMKHPPPHRQLNIVNIVPHKDGQQGSWEVVPKGEIRELRKPLSRATDTPFHDLDDDTTILWVCPKRFWRRIRRRIRRMHRCSAGSQFVQTSRDIITARCGSDVLSMVCGRRGAVKTAPPPITIEPMLAGTSDLCIQNDSTRLSDAEGIKTGYMQLKYKTFDFADYQ